MHAISQNVGKSMLFENQRIRVWDMVLEPGESCELHHHDHDYLFVYVTPSMISGWGPDLPSEERTFQDGFVQYTTVGDRGLTHQIKNIGSQVHRQVLIEFLGPSQSRLAQQPETNGRRS